MNDHEEEIVRLLAIEPSPEFTARVRDRVARERMAPVWRGRWAVAGALAAAATVVLAIWLGPRGFEDTRITTKARSLEPGTTKTRGHEERTTKTRRHDEITAKAATTKSRSLEPGTTRARRHDEITTKAATTKIRSLEEDTAKTRKDEEFAVLVPQGEADVLRRLARGEFAAYVPPAAATTAAAPPPLAPLSTVELAPLPQLSAVNLEPLRVAADQEGARP